MRISTSAYSFTAFDGKIILRSVIDKPADPHSNVLTYLYDYSNKIDAFVRNELYESILRRYKESNIGNDRFCAFSFSFRIICTYTSEVINSYLMISSLYQGQTHLTSNADSVIAKGDMIVPPKMITGKVKKNETLALDNDGDPIWINVTAGEIIKTPAEKCRMLK